MRLPSSCWRLYEHEVSQTLQLDLCSDYRDLDVSMMMMCYRQNHATITDQFLSWYLNVEVR